MGQSSGWLMSSSSITPSRAFFTSGVLVFTFMPGPAGIAHDATGLGLFSTCGRAAAAASVSGGCGRRSAAAAPAGRWAGCGPGRDSGGPAWLQEVPVLAQLLHTALEVGRGMAERRRRRRTSTKHILQLPAMDSRWW